MLDLMAGAREYVQEKMQPVSGLLGSSTVFGVMPDWNPAEMIGPSPRPLAISLYQHLIGNESWAEARYRMGYRDVRPEQLIVALGGRPYVDVRASLNSFLPATLDDNIGARWVDACLEHLRAQPALHDKIEFDVTLTCLSPDWKKFSGRLGEARIDSNQFAGHLRHLTNRILTGAVEPIDQQLALLKHLAERRQRDLAGANANVHFGARAIGRILNDCRRFGVVPFSILARYAFISMNFLRGLSSIGLIDEEGYQGFLRSVPTVAGDVAEDLGKNLPVSELVEKYGHLRPNSYEITSPNYARDPEQFLRAPPPGGGVSPGSASTAALNGCAKAINGALADLGLDIDTAALSSFIRRSIAGREQAKFEFMKNLNAALEMIASLGGRIGLDRDEMSFLEIGDILRLEANSLTSADITQLRRRATFNEKRWSATRALRLPDLIRNAGEVSAFRLEAWRANFITKKRVTAPAVWLDDAAVPPKIQGAIVVTRAADPGYDWIFAHGIAGLITEYGGVASHMAIRAAEFGLPAAIGCGAVVMDALRGAGTIELDCAAERVKRLS
jgi:phosphohistidine swiveling domain-containing protein